MNYLFVPDKIGNVRCDGMRGRLQPTGTKSVGRKFVAESVEAAVAASPDLEWHTPPPIEPLTARQLRLWLLSAGLSSAMVEARINAIPNATARAAALVEWEYSVTYHRDHPLVIQLGSALGLNPTQIDAAFRAAVGL